jgi:hypothetical protein
MNFSLSILIAACGLFLGMLLCFQLGRRIGVARLARDPNGVATGSAPVEAAVFGLLGLLLAFTFSGAASRFEERRLLIGREANAIGTAYLRVDLLPSDSQPEIRELFRRYLDARVATYRNAEDAIATDATLTEVNTLQRAIWAKAVSASARQEATTTAAMLMLPALNEMIDITTTRAVAMKDHPPRVIFLLLAGLSLVSSLLSGYVMCSTRTRSWFYMLLIATTMSVTLFVILDLEYPRFGLIRIDAADQVLIELRGLMR